VTMPFRFDATVGERLPRSTQVKAPGSGRQMTTMTTTFSRKRFLWAAGGTLAGSALLAPSSGARTRASRAAVGQSGILEVPGAALYYETHGSGPLMLMIPGAAGTADAFRRVVQSLSASYTVVLYDRRGFSRSQLHGVQDYEHRMRTEADDARRLIEHVSDGPVTVFGNSSGGLVALEVLARSPSVVRTLVPHEPPAMRLLRDGEKWLHFFLGLYDLYRQAGSAPAQMKFGDQMLTDSDRRSLPPPPADGQPILVNTTYWFERELRQYPSVRIDLRALRRHAKRIVPVVGRESRGYPPHRAAVRLANRLGRDVIELPGGHLGFLAQPAEFANALAQALARDAP
jgi:acetyltransferase/esterase